MNARPADGEAHRDAAGAAERVTAAGQYGHAGHADRAERLRREASILLAVLDEME